jgi:hypothetical protein
MRSSFLLCAFLIGCGSSVDENNSTTTDTGSAAVVDSATTTDTRTNDTSVVVTDTGTVATDTSVVDSGKPMLDSATSDTMTSFDTGGGDSDPFGAGCNTVEQKGSPVKPAAALGSAPTWTGGTIADGTYVMTKWLIYGGGMVSPEPVSETLVVSAGTFKVVANTSMFTVRTNGSVTVSGSTMTFTPSCPSSAKGDTSSFSATATEFVAGKPDGTEAVWFTKL